MSVSCVSWKDYSKAIFCHLLRSPIYQKALDIPKILFSQKCLRNCTHVDVPPPPWLYSPNYFFCNLSSCVVKNAPTIRPCRCNMTSKIPNHGWFLFPRFCWDKPVLDSDFSAAEHDDVLLKIYFHNFVILLVKGLFYQQKMDQDTAPHDNDPDFSSQSMKLGHIKDLSCCARAVQSPRPCTRMPEPQFCTDLLYEP